MKKILSLFLAIIIVFGLSSCTEETKTVELDITEVAEKLGEKLNFDDEIVKLSDSKAETMYGFAADKIVVWAGSGATAEVIIVAEYSDETLAKEGLGYIKEYIANQKELYSSYAPLESSKLDAAYCEQHQKYVIAVVAPEGQDIHGIIQEIIG